MQLQGTRATKRRNARHIPSTGLGISVETLPGMISTVSLTAGTVAKAARVAMAGTAGRSTFVITTGSSPMTLDLEATGEMAEAEVEAGMAARSSKRTIAGSPSIDII